MDWLYGILIFYSGIFVGYAIRAWLQYRSSYNGAILITEEADKKIYSLVLDDYPEKIELRKEVILKVITDKETPVADET